MAPREEKKLVEKWMKRQDDYNWLEGRTLESGGQMCARTGG